MERDRINSSNLYSTGHDETGMEVQFHKKDCLQSDGMLCDCGGGDVFHYENVPADLHQALRESLSPGAFLHRSIKQARTPDLQPQYPGRRI